MASAITDLKILVGDQPLPANFKKIPVDLNAGAGGEYLWLAYEQDETKGPESWVTGLDVIEGPNAKPPDGYTKDDTDLNAGAGGRFLYLVFKQGGSDNPIKDIQVIEARYTPENVMMPGYRFVNRDLNEGSGGLWLYLVYSHVSESIGLVAIQMSMLPDGRVLCYGSPLQGNDLHAHHNQQLGRDVVIFDPAFNPASDAPKEFDNVISMDSFCGAAIYYRSGAGGRLCVVGGNPEARGPGDRATRLIDYSDLNRSYGSDSQLKYPRWYASLVKLADNRILAVGGAESYYHNAFMDLGHQESWGWKKMKNTAISATPEVFDGSKWEELAGAYSWEAFGRENNEWWYPRAYLASNGKVFGVSGNRVWVLDPSFPETEVRTVQSTGADASPEENTGLQSAGYETVPVKGKGRTEIKASLEGHFAGASCTSVMFAPDKIAVFAGGQRGNEDTGQRGAFKNAIPLDGKANGSVSIVDYKEGNPTVTSAEPMKFPRNWSTAVVLPNGEVAIVGGTRIWNSYGEGDWVKEVEIWTPPSPGKPGGAWRTEGAISKARLYHSTAILLTDGSILIGGGGLPPASDWPNGNSDGKGKADFKNTPYRDVERYEPPYLRNAAGWPVPRPGIQYVSGDARYGGTIKVKIQNLLEEDTDQNTSVSIINMPSITHGHNNDQRFRTLNFRLARGSSPTLDIDIPNEPNSLPPGCYMIFFVNSKGVPSKALKISGGLVELTSQ